VREDGGAALNVVVRLAPALREHAGGASRVELTLAEPATVEAVLDALAARHPAIGRRVRDESGVLRTHVNVFVGADNARDLDGVGTPVSAGTEVSILAAISGG
jgi:molybdopterin converting factor small subunit